MGARDKGREHLKPESRMMSEGYNPEWSEGAIKPPIFPSSTFVFPTAEAGEKFFAVATGDKEKDPDEPLSLAYGRINHPDLEIFEDRLKVWDGAEACAGFESGMAAIDTVLREFLKPGDTILHSGPIYGGTDHLIKNILAKWGVNSTEFVASDSKEEIVNKLKRAESRRYEYHKRLALILIETPANPTNSLIDIEMCVDIAREFSSSTHRVRVAVDNTFLGPIFQHPIQHGADLVIYSATKYIGGHSDLVAGACLGSNEDIARIKSMRGHLGNMTGPWTSWLLLRSLETLKLRMDKQAENAQHLAHFLNGHPKVEHVYYLGLLSPKNEPEQFKIFQRQCLSPGAMISFDIKGGKEEAFRFLNALKLAKLAVSLGGTESLAEHPAKMTHYGVSQEDKHRLGINDKMIRFSVGIEDCKDLEWDLEQALDAI